MNYFSHYYFDHEYAEHAYNTGLVLPDFARTFIKGARFKLGEEIPHEQAERFRRGAVAHIARDQKFHQSLYFKQSAEVILEKLKSIPPDRRIARSWFGAHLLSEMLLDRVLIKERKEWLGHFYESLAESSREGLSYFLKASGIERQSDFLRGLDRFTEARYLYHYLDNESLVYSLNRVYMGVKADGIWRYDQKRALVEMIDEVEILIFEQLPNLHSQMA